MAQISRGMGFGQERRELKEKQGRLGEADLPVEGLGCRSCVHGNFCFGKGVIGEWNKD